MCKEKNNNKEEKRNKNNSKKEWPNILCFDMSDTSWQVKYQRSMGFF